jgi:hypothetical protein
VQIRLYRHRTKPSPGLDGLTVCDGRTSTTAGIHTAGHVVLVLPFRSTSISVAIKCTRGIFIDTNRSMSKKLLLVASISYMLKDKIFMISSFAPSAVRRFKNLVRRVTRTPSKLSKYRSRHGSGVLFHWNSHRLEVLVGRKT